MLLLLFFSRTTFNHLFGNGTDEHECITFTHSESDENEHVDDDVKLNNLCCCLICFVFLPSSNCFILASSQFPSAFNFILSFYVFPWSLAAIDMHSCMHYTKEAWACILIKYIVKRCPIQYHINRIKWNCVVHVLRTATYASCISNSTAQSDEKKYETTAKQKTTMANQ